MSGIQTIAFPAGASQSAIGAAMSSDRKPGDLIQLNEMPSPDLLAQYERVGPGLGRLVLEIVRNERELMRRRIAIERGRSAALSFLSVWTPSDIARITVNLFAVACSTRLALSGLPWHAAISLVCWATVASFTGSRR